MMSSMERRGRTPAARSARIASSPPSTPTTPSKQPGVGDGVDVGAGGHRRAVRLLALPAGEDVAHRVNAHRQAGRLHALHQPGAGA